MLNKPRLIEQLEIFGLANKEARAFIACLELGTAKMTDIARQADLKRPTTYLVIEDLEKKNLISRIQKGKIDYYKAVAPQTLLEVELEKTHMIKELIPSLCDISEQRDKANITLFEGKEQLSRVHELLFRSKDLFSLVYLDEYWKLFGEEHNRHLYEILKRHGGLSHLLLPKTKKIIEYIERKYRNGMQEIRFLPSDFKTENRVSIAFNESLVVFISYGSITATVIEDKDILAFQKQMWQHLWNQSVPYEA